MPIDALKATDKSVTGVFRNPPLPGVDNSGLLVAKKDGTVTVFATANDDSEIQGYIVIKNV